MTPLLEKLFCADTGYSLRSEVENLKSFFTLMEMTENQESFFSLMEMIENYKSFYKQRTLNHFHLPWCRGVARSFDTKEIFFPKPPSRQTLTIMYFSRLTNNLSLGESLLRSNESFQKLPVELPNESTKSQFVKARDFECQNIGLSTNCGGNDDETEQDLMVLSSRLLRNIWAFIRDRNTVKSLDQVIRSEGREHNHLPHGAVMAKPRKTCACLREDMAWGLSPAAWGGGEGKLEDMSDVRVPMRPPIAAPWTAPVPVTTAASTGRGCFASHDRNPASTSLNRD
ncbi:hypothetical protein M5K25_027362 [Dendrobium thyrsiflorum]|uniref:Uncharacterized protein n=1 Tax=Dendrobium thyrsiflorum TaxID=117978 RepID=A0ABD0TZS4_DENTH